MKCRSNTLTSKLASFTRCASKTFAVAVAAATISTQAFAGDLHDGEEVSLKDTTYEEPRSFQISANVAIASDYAFRGFTETDEGPSIQGGFDFIWDWFYIGVWASNLDYNNNDDYWSGGDANIEMDIYAGIQKTINSVTFDLALFYYAYPNATEPYGDYDFWEVKAGLSGYVLDQLKLGFFVYYSPDYFEESGNNWIFELTSKKTLPYFWKFNPAFFASIAYQEGDEDEGGFDYWFWKAGVELKFYENYAIELKYVDTIDVPFSCDDLCDGRFIAALKAEF